MKLREKRQRAVEEMSQDGPIPERGDDETLAVWYERCLLAWLVEDRPQERIEAYHALLPGQRGKVGSSGTTWDRR